MREDSNIVVKVRYKNGAFIPIEKIDKKFSGEEIIEMEIRKHKFFSWRGALKGEKGTSVEVQHKIKDMW